MQTRTILPLALLVIPVGLAMADTPLSNPDTLPKVSCNDLHYSSEFLQRYPKAPAACIEARVANGEKYAKFNAKVYLVKLPDFITIEWLDVAGMPTSTFSLKPPPGEQIVVNGKSMPISEVKPGDTITLWIPEKRFEARALPASTSASWWVLPPRQASK